MLFRMKEIGNMRLNQAPAPTFTDAAGNNEKARARSAGEHQGQRAVVNSLKPTGVSGCTLAPVTSPTHPVSDAAKLASTLSRRSPVKASNGADNEHSAIRETDSNHRCADGRTVDPSRRASIGRRTKHCRALGASRRPRLRALA